MNSTALYNLIREAQQKDRAVRLVMKNEVNWESEIMYIIEPEMEFHFPTHDTIQVETCLIDLAYIVSAFEFPKKCEREASDLMTELMEECM